LRIADDVDEIFTFHDGEGADEVLALTPAYLRDCSRSVDQQTDWALRRLEKENIRVSIADWAQNDRAFTARARGQDVRGNVSVADDSLWLEATVPWTIGVFAPAIEAVAKHYAARLLAPEGVA
jgi:hypothetical protein